MRAIKSQSMSPLYSDKDIEDSTERTRFFPYDSVISCINEVHPINSGLKVIGYRVTSQGIELVLKS
jgi:hypothetical protein